ncbi:M23 family metallopeptidase [Paenibacillus caui]|uniref:M23 family metallopeptidase n=1 Tax=Paenibacillus caui TaxID=2873927 RepID=UPI001F3E5013|nr:M23 family metallopeptidase [Paenibacillus caui]
MSHAVKGCGKMLTSALTVLILITQSPASIAWAETTKQADPIQKQAAPSSDEILGQRGELIREISELTHVPWVYLAAVDQYERTVTPKSKAEKLKGRLIGINPRPEFWAGWLNPDPEDTRPVSISLFGGIGRDATGDGTANPADDLDTLYSMACYLKRYGLSEEDFHIALWRYYQNDRAVSRVRQFVKIYQAFGKLDLFQTSFVLPLSSSYSYRSTWGDRRGFGGLRIHEGTDLFAPYGVPVRSACYGIIEMKGWNRFGGWRVGIRDLNNRYHYYAHLQGFDKKIDVGSLVVPGQVIGWVGSSGYGKPGTQGKFPPHLHYGIYRDTGYNEWAFDPYPLLKRWENEERRKRK